MRSYQWVAWVAAAAASSLLLTACSLGKDESDAQKVTIASIMGMADPDDFDLNVSIDAIEEGVADCMAKEGWSYFPRKVPDLHPEFEDDDAAEVARIEKEGLGITSLLLVDDTAEDASGDPWGSYDDKNRDYANALTESERTAYDASLYGTQEEQDADKTTAVDPATGEQVAIDLRSVGCRGEARDAYYGDDPAHNPVYTQVMQAYWDELDQRTTADPRFVKAIEDWSACMKAAGYDYESPTKFSDATYLEFQTRDEDVVGADFYADPTAGWTEEEIAAFWKDATPDEVAALYSSPTEITADQRKELESILVDEVAVALAEHECSKALDAKALVISADVEAQYALEHEAEFKQLAASLANGK